nr:serine/threonine-protein kinase [Pseudenhygromyxa sp. WMMC2535]
MADRYKVVSVIGDGGMGKVYLGEHVTLRKKVAIKVLKQEFCHDRTNVERFLQEARAASMIRHENIVDIMDFGQVPGGSVFFVMELLEGGDLSDLLKQVGRLPWLRTRNVLLQVVRALRAAHDAGIIHRDMKPANVFLIDRSGFTDYAKVLDFGIAKVDDQGTGLTRTGAVFGTAGYMAPEQACGDPVDARTDVYAVGCMMYEMLTGRLPFPGTNFMRVLTQHMNEPPPPPRDVAPDADISDEVETIILTALSKKAEDRFASMADFERAIAQANGEVATVPPQNRPRTSDGTVVLDTGAASPFAGMTPGQPPSGYGSNGGEEGDGATMMLDGMGGVDLGSGGEGDGATMMLDGMGGVDLGAGEQDSDSTVMLEGGGMFEDIATAEYGGAEAQAMVDHAAGVMAASSAEQAANKKKRMIMIGGGVGALAIVGILAAVLLGGGDELAAGDSAAEASAAEAGVAGDPAAGEDAADEAGEPAEGVAADEAGEAGEAGEDAAEAGEDAGAADGAVVGDPAGGSDEGLVLEEDEDEGAADEDDGEVESNGPEPTKKATTTKVKESLSDSDVNRGLKRIKSKVSACKSQGGLPGMKVKVNFLIADGKVSSASPRPPHNNTKVGKCVADAVKKARFTKAKQSKIVDETFTL